MAAREAQAIYASIFELLGKDPTPQHRRWAKKLWRESLEYDFSSVDMRCDVELIALGLAKVKWVTDQWEFGDNEEHEVVMYLRPNGSFDY